jgi:hypothetical protein
LEYIFVFKFFKWDLEFFRNVEKKKFIGVEKSVGLKILGGLKIFLSFLLPSCCLRTCVAFRTQTALPTRTHKLVLVYSETCWSTKIFFLPSSRKNLGKNPLVSPLFSSPTLTPQCMIWPLTLDITAPGNLYL